MAFLRKAAPLAPILAGDGNVLGSTTPLMVRVESERLRGTTASRSGVSNMSVYLDVKE
jgi:hypothetical protein